MKRHIGAAVAVLLALSSHAHGSESGSSTGSGSGSGSSGLAGLFGGVLEFRTPSGFSLIESPPPLIDYEERYSSQTLTFSLTPSGNQAYAFDFFYTAPTASHVGLLKLDAWFEPALTGAGYTTISAPQATVSVDPAFILGGTVTRTAIVPIAPGMQTPVTVTLSDYRSGIAGACVGGLSQCLYTADPGTLKVKIEMSVTAVPEPSIYALMGLGLIGLACARRRHAPA